MSPYRDQVDEILRHLDPDMPREEWVHVAMALKDEFREEGFHLFDRWSKPGKSYSEKDTRDTWRSLRGSGITFGNLVHDAKEAGWEPLPPVTNASGQKQTPKYKLPSLVDWWSGSTPKNHPYLEQKGIQGAADQLRVRDSDGALLVPMNDDEGKLKTVQAIFADGTKLFAKGQGLAKGSRLVLGNMFQKKRAFIVEGLATGWSVHEATQEPVIVAFSAGWIPSLARELIEASPGCTFVVAADAGPAGESAAEKAQKLGCKVAIPATGDWNDRAQAGADIRAEILQQVEGSDSDGPPLETLLVDFMIEPPPPDYVVKKYLPRRQVTLLAGHGASGKSTLALQIAAAMVHGQKPFLGVGRTGRALFVSAEDDGRDINWLLRKICDVMEMELPRLRENLLLMDASEDGPLFQEEKDRDLGTMVGRVTGLYRRLGSFLTRNQVDLVIVDNASDTYSANENDRRLVRGFVRSLKKLAKEHDLAILLLGHVNRTSASRRNGKSTEDYSGSTAWHNSVRSRIFLQVDEDDPDRAILRHQKAQKDAPAADVELVREKGVWIEQGRPSRRQADATELYQRLESERQATEDGLVLAAIKERLELGDVISCQFNSPASAFKILEATGALPEVFQKGKPTLARQKFNAALTRLEKTGALVREQYKNSHYETKQKWAIPPDISRSATPTSAPLRDSDPTGEQQSEATHL